MMSNMLYDNFCQAWVRFKKSKDKRKLDDLTGQKLEERYIGTGKSQKSLANVSVGEESTTV